MTKKDDRYYREKLLDKFGIYNLDRNDMDVIYDIFLLYVQLAEKKRGGAVADIQIRGIVDTVDFSVRNILNILHKDVTYLMEET